MLKSAATTVLQKYSLYVTLLYNAQQHQALPPQENLYFICGMMLVPNEPLS